MKKFYTLTKFNCELPRDYSYIRYFVTDKYSWKFGFWKDFKFHNDPSSYNCWDLKKKVILRFISLRVCIITNFLACKINKLIESLLFKHEIKRDRWANKSQLIPPFLAILLYVREIALWVFWNESNEPKHRKTMLQISKKTIVNYQKSKVEREHFSATRSWLLSCFRSHSSTL